MICEEIYEALRQNADGNYRLFQAKLMPNVDPGRIIGVRTPVVRRLAREYAKRQDIGEFLTDLPHRTYDENNLHGFILSLSRDYEGTVAMVDAFLPYVDNWATCDLLSPAIFRKNRGRLCREIDRWLQSGETYTVRFGIEMLMSHYLDADFDPRCLQKVAEVQSEEYYVNMMIAWFFATALAKQWESTLPYLTAFRLPVWVHNKTIRKAIESYRITDEQKEFLRSLSVPTGKGKPDRGIKTEKTEKGDNEP